MIRAIIHEKGKLRTSSSAKEIEVAFHHKGARLWVDFAAPTDEERTLLRKIFGFHPLTVQDTTHYTGVPKLEDHEDYLFLMFQRLTEGKGTIKTNEVSFYLTQRCMVTVHNDKDVDAIDNLAASINKNPKLMADPSMLLHGVLDYVVDRYVEVLDKWEERAVKIESQLLATSQKNPDMAIVLRMRRRTGQLKRSILAQQDIIQRLERQESTLISKHSVPYFRDVNDHLTTVSNVLDNVKETIQGAFDAYMSIANQQMNDIMYKLTVVASIFIPLTFITGVYGMNFRWMPFLHNANGFWMVTAFMAIVGVLFWFYLRSRK